ncbi:DUF1534 domain-containing protein [Pseudomonas sp. PA-5-4G]|nr:DUF1534 domain-containing protein [Pseudomonas sp. PA-5-4H]MCF5235947.1 DUF1534 domain-containing protein [Pseudomonas sp. PA-5-4G]MCF5250094.1 DUF1534 domain-containing protein [Pseudomonas sp. PA-5-4B]MCF5255129.1 DUF1534 domain-containing protein [Pseudomonas sp. PA-5-4B]MCF5263490.1 DUF1534 domain-containing protein [Pseudomonas sp. PA-5-4A]
MGAGLARDGGVSGNISLPDTPPSRASPTPTGFLIVPPLLRGNASRDALRHQCPSLKPCAEVGRGASRAAFPRRACGTISQNGFKGRPSPILQTRSRIQVHQPASVGFAVGIDARPIGGAEQAFANLLRGHFLDRSHAPAWECLP